MKKGKFYMMLGALAFILVLQVLIAPTVAGSAMGGSPQFVITRHGDDYSKPRLETNSTQEILVQTDYMTLKILGSQDHVVPKIRIWYTADENGTEIQFGIDFKFLIEFVDANGDGAYQHNETVPTKYLSLESAVWNYTIIGPYNDSETGTTIDIYLYVVGWQGEEGSEYIPATNTEKPSPPDGENPPDSGYGKEPMWWTSVNASFGVHIYEQPKVVTLGNSSETEDNATYIIFGGYEAKIDFNISNWPFSMDDSMLAVAIYLEDEANEGSQEQMRHRFALEEHDGPRDIDPETVGNETQSTVEHKFRERNEIIQEIRFVSENNNTHGYFKWLTNASVINETETYVDVNASYICDGKALRLYLAFPQFNGTLYYDPVIGVDVKAGDVPGNSPPSILDVIISQIVTLGEQFYAKVNATDDYGVDSVTILLTSPSGVESEYEAVFDGTYYSLTLDTSDWETGTWSAKVRVTDIYGATTVSEEYTVTVTAEEEQLTTLFGIDLTWFVGGVILGLGIVIAAIMLKRRK